MASSLCSSYVVCKGKDVFSVSVRILDGQFHCCKVLLVFKVNYLFVKCSLVFVYIFNKRLNSACIVEFLACTSSSILKGYLYSLVKEGHFPEPMLKCIRIEHGGFKYLIISLEMNQCTG